MLSINRLILFVRICIVATSLVATVPAFGQISSVNADGQAVTGYSYPLPDGSFTRDKIFIFNQIPPKKGDLKMIADSTSSSDYEWYRYDYGAKSFETTPFAVETNVASSQQDTLKPGGYMVKTNTGGVRDSAVAWVCFNQGFDLVLMKDDKGGVMELDRHCDFIDFRIDADHPVTIVRFDYHSPFTGTLYHWTTESTMFFTIDGQKVYLNSTGSQQFLRLYEPPNEDKTFKITGDDGFGIVREAEINYVTTLPKVEMDALLPEERILADGSKSNPNSAPVDVRLVNNSVNAVEFRWSFGDGDSISYGGDFEPHPDTVYHTYLVPKDYSLVLHATSDYGCEDTAQTTIKVDPSRLDVANVFSPNGDNINDYFKPENASLSRFEISIYTRAGKRVYRYRGDDLHYWSGWDGRTDNGHECAAGVYYFVIRGTGYDDKDYGWNNKKADTYRSYVYLYR